MSRPRIAIIGAGYSGLTAARELLRAGIRPVIYEAGSRAGGLASALPFGWTQIERFYHHWFNCDEDILGLVRELGLGQDLISRPTTTSTFLQGGLHRLSSPGDLLRFRPLRLRDRLRMARLVLQGRTVWDHRKLEGISARSWITRMAGRGVYDVVWKPLFEGKFGPYADEISAVWFWSKLQSRGRSRSKGGREELVYLRGGFQRLTDALVQAVRDGGGRIELGACVEQIARAGGAWQVRTNEGDEAFDHVIVTAPTPVAVKMIDDLPEAYRRQSRAIPYLGVTELMLVLNRPLTQAYWINMNEPGSPFVGLIEHTNFIPPADYDGHHIAYLTRYRHRDDETAGMGTQALMDQWQPWVQRVVPDFEESWLQTVLSFKSEYAQPVVRAGCEKQILPIETPLPGIWHCSMAQVYPQDRGTNFAVRFGRIAAHRVLDAVTRPEPARRVIRVPWSELGPRDASPLNPLPGLEGPAPA